MSSYAPTAIDLSRLPPPSAIEAWSPEQLIAAGKARFLEQWTAEQAIDPSLPDFTEDRLETHPTIITLRTFAGLRGIDRQRVNDAFRALLAPLARRSNLDAAAASRNLERLTIVPASAGVAAIMESDTALLRRYLLSFDKPAAGSRDRYLLEAYTVWPQSEDKTLGLWDARVNGFDVHGRRGDTDLVIIGPAGRLPTELERTTVRNAVTAPHIKPDAVSVSVLAAQRVEYTASLVIEVPGIGPSPEVIKAEAEARVTAAALTRTLIGGEIPAGFLVSAAYGDNVIKVRDLAPVVIEPDPYKVPVMTAVEVAVEIRS